MHRFVSRKSIVAVCLSCVVLWLSLAGLGNNAFWDDEAQVGFFARNLVRNGTLSGWDGRNLFAVNNGGFLDSRLMPRNSPLDFLLCAASFRLFGVGTVQGRLPFVLAGLGALAVFVGLLRSEGSGQPRLGWYSAALLGLHYSFILSIRQCRYYALALLFSLLLYQSYRKLKERVSWGVAAQVALWGLLLFFANYLIAGAFLGALALMHLLVYRRTSSTKVLWYGAGSAVVMAAVVIPFALVNKIWVRPDAVPGGNALADRLTLLFWNLRELDLTGYLPGLLGAVGIWCVLQARKRREAVPALVVESAVLSALFLLLLSLFSHQTARWAGYAGGLADIRYFVVVLPLCMIVCGWILVQIDIVYHWSVAVCLGVLLLSTTLLSVTLNGSAVRFPLPGVMAEVNRDYVTPYDAVIGYLDSAASQDDLVYATPEYANYPIMFALGDKVKIAGIVRKDSHLDSALIDSLAPHIHDYHAAPKWFISLGHQKEGAEKLDYFSRGDNRYGCRGVQNCQPHAVLGSYWRDRTRPELPWHSFGPVKRYNPAVEDIFVFKKR